MKPKTLEWIEKAEEDFVAASIAVRPRKHPLFNTACFHAQQCAEKYLKAKLHEAGKRIDKTHNLIDLLNQVLLIERAWTSLHADLGVLNGFSVDYRYPGLSATKPQAQDAVKRCRQVRRVIRQSFGLPV
jgi:HEPN domain-containing protein